MVNTQEKPVTTAYASQEGSVRSAVMTKPFYFFVKRCFDVIISLITMIVLLPLMLLIAVAIKLDSKGKVIFKQNRVGKGGELFLIYKFRTMSTSAPSEMATKDLDNPYSYITRVGSFLRKTSLDELPQFLNVIKGDMSIIGPRPLIEAELEIHRLRAEKGVYSVRPGLTGWAQVNGRDDISDEEKAAYDSEYVQRCSVGFDIRIMLRSISVVFKRDGYREGKKE